MLDVSTSAVLSAVEYPTRFIRESDHAMLPVTAVVTEPAAFHGGGEILVVDAATIPAAVARIRELPEPGGTLVAVGLPEIAAQSALAASVDTSGMSVAHCAQQVDVTTYVRDLNQVVETLRRASLSKILKLHDALVAAVMSGAELETILKLTARQVSGFDAMFVDYTGAVISSWSHRGQRSLRLPADLAMVLKTSPPIDTTQVEVGDGRVAVLVSVGLHNQVEGAIVYLGPRRLSAPELLLVERARAAVLLRFARETSRRDARRATVEQLLRAAVEGSMSHEKLTSALRGLGLEPAEGYCVLAVRLDRSIPGARALTVLEDIAAASTQPIVGGLQGKIFCLVQPVDSTVPEDFLQACHHRGWKAVTVGRSRPKTDAESFALAIREAATAAQSSRQTASQIQDVTALGLPGLLAGLDPQGVMQPFVDTLLGELLSHDATHNSELVRTLAAYFDLGCRPGPTAERLCIHRHTLSYRLDRVAELTGKDPRGPEWLLSFGIALQMHAILDASL
ncbi:CdaR family transcriptional regulator [Micromonospora sp. MW-13]|uniref:PucR family transcriptional regulator n=1 Tax=Micromonospora sp. MW-13 TaxID=2094022 RepID=UPI000FFF600F|nr:helix-turn-helix domain-containing protein [Micromonospora sp. MW-13]